MSATEIRGALLAPDGGFRSDATTIAGQPAVVREPGAGDWLFSGEKAREWLGLAPEASADDVRTAAKTDAGRGLDAALLVRVLFDTNGQRVFSDVDADVLRAQWGPQYARIVTRALALATLDTPSPVDDAKNGSPETQAVSS